MAIMYIQYKIAPPRYLPVRVAGRQRQKMFDGLMTRMAPSSDDDIVDGGAMTDDGYGHSNYLMAWYSQKIALPRLGWLMPSRWGVAPRSSLPGAAEKTEE